MTDNLCGRIPLMRFYHSVIPPNDANGIANIVDTDQTVKSCQIRICIVCSNLSKNIDSLRYQGARWPGG